VAKAAKYIAVLGIALAVAAALAGAVASQRVGTRAYEASAIAALINWVAGSLGLVTIVATRNTLHRINGALAAMASRMVLPLIAVLYFTRSHHPLVGYGIVGFIVVHYLIGLTIETLMTLRLVSGKDFTGSNSPPGPPSSPMF
jgi:hypothetical protein